MAWYRIAENVLDAIANAINAKTGHTAPMTPVEMVLEIQSIPTGGGGSETIFGGPFAVVHRERLTIGENNVEDALDYYNYLVGIKSAPGSLIGLTIPTKETYRENEWGCAVTVGSQSAYVGYRYKNNAWARTSFAYDYDTSLVAGDVVDIFTFEIKNPSEV